MKTSKRIVALLLTFVMLFSMVGCGNKDTPPKEGNGGSQETGSKGGENVSNNLVVYVSHKEDVYGPIVKEFQERTGIQVDIVAAGTGEMLSRIETESTNPQGDIMFGGGVESLEAYKEYFEPYKTKEADSIDKAFLAADNTWTGFSALPLVIMYNKKLVSEADVPKTWEGLLDEKFKGQIAYTDPNLSGSSFTTLVTMMYAHPEDDGWAFVRKFVDNLDGKLLNSSSAIFKGVADGEYSVGITLEESAQRYVIAGAEVGFVYPEEGTSMVPDGVAIIKGAKNMENAKEFVDFVVGEDIQNMIVSDMSRRSIRSDVAPSEGLVDIDEIPAVDYDVAWVSKNKADLMNKWKDVLVGK